jgi:preprotein translocase subunit SecF
VQEFGADASLMIRVQSQDGGDNAEQSVVQKVQANCGT